MKTIRVEASGNYQPTGELTYNKTKTIFNVPGPYQDYYHRERNVGVCIEFSEGWSALGSAKISSVDFYVYLDASGNSYTEGTNPDYMPGVPFDFNGLSKNYYGRY